MADKLPSDDFMRALLGDTFMIQHGIRTESGSELTRKTVAAEPCTCVRCCMCSGTGRIRVDHWSGYDTEPCEDCDNGITEPCGRCEYLADLDREPNE